MWARITAVFLLLGPSKVFSKGLESPLKCWESLPCQHSTSVGTCSLVDNNGSCVMECTDEYEISSDGKYHTTIIFYIHEEIPDTSNETTFNVSVGLETIAKTYLKKRGGLVVNLHFDRTVAVGTALVSRRCFNTNRTRRFENCTCVVSLEDNIQAQGVFKYELTDENFWNFQSPVQPGWFKTLYAHGVRRIPFVDNSLESLQNTSFERVSLFHNYGNLPDAPLLKNMAYLQKLNLGYSRLTEFHKDSFIGMPKLEHLKLSGNMFTTIPPMIERIPTLKTLDISSNSFTKFTLQINVLSNLLFLETLNLSNNAIFSISGKLPPLPNLKQLRLRECVLLYLQDNAFKNVPALEILDLSENILEKIEENTFRSLRHLKTLLLSTNNLVEWPILYSLSLQTLDVSSNYLSSLKKLGYTGTTVEYLDISNNNISDWEDTNIFVYSPSRITYSNLPPLQPISRTPQHNILSKLESNISSNYSLAHQQSEVPNTIKQIPSPTRETFNVSLKQYYDDSSMDDNEYSNPQHNLNKASANHNNNISKKTYVSSSYVISEDVPWVNSIDLSRNVITFLSEAMRKSLDGVKVVDLGGNHFDCSDCQMPQLQQWLNRTTTRVHNLKCASPFAQLNVPVLEVEFDEELCLDKRKALWITIGIIITLILCALLIVTVFFYRFRSQATYMLHLYNIRRRAMDFSTARYDNCAFDAFICYSNKDRRFVLKRLTPFLEDTPERYKLCLHERDFPLGSRIVDNIIGSIEHSRKTVMVLSENFVNSKWCKWELEMANHKMFNDDEHFLVLIQLEELNRGTLPLHLKFFMDTRTCLQWLKEDQDEEMHRRLKRALGKSIFQRTSEEAPRLSVLMGDD